MSAVKPATRSLDKGVIRLLERAVGKNAVLWRPEEVLAFEYDGTIERAMPQAVAFPDSAEQVAAGGSIALNAGLPVVPRGAGTGLSGGAVAALGGVVVALTRMKRILEIDADDQLAVVEPEFEPVEPELVVFGMGVPGAGLGLLEAGDHALDRVGP